MQIVVEAITELSNMVSSSTSSPYTHKEIMCAVSNWYDGTGYYCTRFSNTRNKRLSRRVVYIDSSKRRHVISRLQEQRKYITVLHLGKVVPSWLVHVRTLLAMSDSLVTYAPNDHHCMRLIFAEPLYISLGAVKDTATICTCADIAN
jgi:hypothetical protein